jgi:hypothetical protein
MTLGHLRNVPPTEPSPLDGMCAQHSEHRLVVFPRRFRTQRPCPASALHRGPAVLRYEGDRELVERVARGRASPVGYLGTSPLNALTKRAAFGWLKNEHTALNQTATLPAARACQSSSRGIPAVDEADSSGHAKPDRYQPPYTSVPRSRSADLSCAVARASAATLPPSRLAGDACLALRASRVFDVETDSTRLPNSAVPQTSDCWYTVCALE